MTWGLMDVGTIRAALVVFAVAGACAGVCWPLRRGSRLRAYILWSLVACALAVGATFRASRSVPWGAVAVLGLVFGATLGERDYRMTREDATRALLRRR